jgi:hypothetical protein
MRTRTKFALTLFLLWAAAFTPVVTAQAYDDSADHVLVSAEQGQALAEFALQAGSRVRPKPDCSHLVHLLYERAGLVYPYEGSRVLYHGIADFERVKTPQPGDLAVWLGHVGIVLSPEDTTFLSSVRSGIITESWKADHWVRRGRPRFFRYRIGPAADLTLLAAIMDDDGNAQNSSRSRSAAVQTSLPDGSQSQAKKRESDIPAMQVAREVNPVQLGEPEGAANSGSIVAVIDQRGTPNKREITAAVIESANIHARQLISGRMLDLAHPFDVFDRLEIAKVKIRHGSGSFTIRVSETMSQESGKILPARTMEHELMIDRRNDGAWVISDPHRHTYLPQAQAVSVFERQAAIFLERAPNSSGTRTVVKFLDRLYDQQPGAPQRAAVK